jgi:leucyl/phenylalanyl-tRNA---protein transferase
VIARPNKSITPEIVLHAYRQGLFPMADGRGEIEFCAYDPRGIIPLDERFRIRRSLRHAIEKKNYRITFDTAPLEVLRGCARFGEDILMEERWLSEELIEIYLKLFEMGTMHTVEIWNANTLTGGLYGLTIGAAFCGESMFSHAPFASQIALVHLVERLRMKGFQLLDAQMPSEHLEQFGLYECSQEEYIPLFHAAAAMDVKW